jgi:hypothetical protein
MTRLRTSGEMDCFASLAMTWRVPRFNLKQLVARMSTAISGAVCERSRMSLRSSGLCLLEPRLHRKRDPKRPEAFDVGKPLCGFARS